MSAMMSAASSMPTLTRTYSGVTAGVRLLLGVELLVGGRGRMDDEGLRVADIREVAAELDAVDEALASLETALDAEAEDGSLAVRKQLLSARVVRMALEPRVVDPLDLRMSL